MGAPLMVGSEAIGVLAIASSDAHAYRAEDAQLLQAFANQAAIAVLNARLFQQTQSVAVSKERERLARELHDAVTQTLFSASILAEALPSQWEQDPDGAQMTLGKLRQLTRGALAEMRTLLLELRPGALTEVGLDSLLRHLGEAMTGSTLVPVFLESTAVDLYLPTDVQLAFYRIAQEALNNITKHADATSVEIMLQGDASDVTLWISDDGKGFDTQAQAPGHLGLTIMHERAQAVGAQITIESTRGQGTRLGLHWSSAGPPDDVRTEAVFQHVMKE
jgi:two-component system nitrate/nitrite sensor histidine kinase NarX